MVHAPLMVTSVYVKVFDMENIAVVYEKPVFANGLYLCLNHLNYLYAIINICVTNMCLDNITLKLLIFAATLFCRINLYISLIFSYFNNIFYSCSTFCLVIFNPFLFLKTHNKYLSKTKDLTWSDMTWPGMAWHGVLMVFLCMVHSIVHNIPVLGRHWINCIRISGEYPRVLFSWVFLTQLVGSPHRHVHHTQATNGTPWHVVVWHGMAYDMIWHEFAGEYKKSLHSASNIFWIIPKFIGNAFILELFQKKKMF